MDSPWVQSFDESMQEQLRRMDVDFIDERKWQAAIRNARYSQALGRYYQRFVHSGEPTVGDLVLRQILNREGLHKLPSSWEGPFKVTEVCRPGCARLVTTEGVSLPNPWNIEHLRKFCHRSKSEGLRFLLFVTRLCIRVCQPGEVRPHKPDLLVCTHAFRVIKERIYPLRCASVIILLCYSFRI
jgi:hypothetical protein